VDYFLGPHSALSFEDADALAAVLPGGRLFDSPFGFYLHASALFKAASLIDHEIHFAQLALSNAPPDWNTTDLWNTVIKGATDMGYWDDAYAALMSTPHELLSVVVVSLRSSAFRRLTIFAGGATVLST
jgi:nuclear pore complex protein Nup160